MNIFPCFVAFLICNNSYPVTIVCIQQGGTYSCTCIAAKWINMAHRGLPTNCISSKLLKLILSVCLRIVSSASLPQTHISLDRNRAPTHHTSAWRSTKDQMQTATLMTSDGTKSLTYDVISMNISVKMVTRSL